MIKRREKLCYLKCKDACMKTFNLSSLYKINNKNARIHCQILFYSSQLTWMNESTIRQKVLEVLYKGLLGFGMMTEVKFLEMH